MAVMMHQISSAMIPATLQMSMWHWWQSPGRFSLHIENYLINKIENKKFYSQILFDLTKRRA